MITRADGGSDHAVAFDAFKITRQGITREYGEGARWKVKALSPWAATMLADPRAAEIVRRNAGVVIGPNDSEGVPGNSDPLDVRRYGLGFERLKDAKGFLSDLESAAAGWWRSATVATYASSMITDTINAGPYDDEDFHRIRVSGKLETKWFNASPAQLAAIAEIMRTEA